MIKAKFVERQNRFTALVEIDGKIEAAHIANSGRLRELFRPGREVFLVRQDKAARVTKYDLALVRFNGRLVSVDARVPNMVVSEAIERGMLDEFRGYSVVRREIRYGASRLDLLLENRDMKRYCYVEVKSVTLVQDNVARFPDAPTERGTRHLGELCGIVRDGHTASVVFLVQREDAESFSPNRSTDPAFADALGKAVREGVKAYAYTCRVSPEEIRIVKQVPVRL